MHNILIKTHFFSAVLIGLLGLVHVSCTPLFFAKLDIGAAAFIGAGLSFINLGILNVVVCRLSDNRIFRIVTVANLLGWIYAALFARLLKEPQAYLAVLLMTVLIGVLLIRLFKRQVSS